MSTNKYYYQDGSTMEYNHYTKIDTHRDKHGNVLYHGPGQDVDIYGILHRLSKPAIERRDGYKAWYTYGKRHRLDGPAIEYSNGDRMWYINGKLHRLDGPAIEYSDGDRMWYIDDTKLNKEEWVKHPAVIWHRCIQYLIEGDNADIQLGDNSNV